MNGRKGNRDSNFANLRVGRRKHAPKEHEAEPISVDTIDNSALIDGDPSNIPTPPVLARGPRGMLVAMLQLAIDDAQRGDQDAVRWLLDEAERGAPGTFTARAVLDHLGIERDAFLERLHVLLRREQQRPDAAINDHVAPDSIAA